jgi:hypothetical protein
MVGCKLAVIVVEGGEVQSTGSGTCVASVICIVDVTDPNFSETFTAVPDEGWYFQKWNSGNGFFCGNSTNPTCTLSFQGYEESKEVEGMVASSEVFYLMPIFKDSPSIVVANGKEWLQPDRFLYLSWNQINAVCPAGVCRDNGTLNGHDMTGWTWASADELNSLFNYYLGAELLGPGPSAYSWSEGENNPPPNRGFANDFYSDGWRAVSEESVPDEYPQNVPNYSRLVSGWISDKGAQAQLLALFVDRVFPWGLAVEVSTNSVISGPQPEPNFGAWFYRAL